MTRSTLRLGLAAIAAVACATEEPLDSRVSQMAIAGPWNAPTRTRAIAATLHVPVVDPPAVAPAGRCASTNPFACSCTHPACMPAFGGTRELNAYLLRRFTYLRAGGTYCCRQNSATTRVPTLSVHATGRAIDLMVPTIGGDADNTRGDAVANWLVENAEFIGVQRVVWDRSFWNGERGFGALSSASLPHTDHLHVELSLAGAAQQTAFFTSGAVRGGACAPRCDGTRVILATCESIDCAATGALCIGGSPPRCGAPPPHEPAEASVVPGAALATVRVAPAARLTLLSPRRVFDTRTPSEATRLVRSGAAGPLSPASNATLSDWSGVGLPSGTRAVWLNLVAVGASGPGFVSAYPAGTARPETSSLNYVAATPRANAAPTSLGEGGGVRFDAVTDTHLIGDVFGAFAATGGGLEVTAPTRVYDSRADGTVLVANAPRAIDVRAPADATGVIASVVVLAGATPGFLRAFACGSPMPEASVINFAAGAVVTNTVASALGASRLCLVSSADAHVVVDVTGYVTPSGPLMYHALTPPTRALDTRSTTTRYTGRLAARQIIELPLQRMPGIAPNVGAAVVNLTAVSPAAPGFLTAFSCGGPVPNTSSLNFASEPATASLALSSLGGGSLCVFASTRTHVIVDLVGVWAGVVAAPVDGGAGSDPIDDGDDLPPMEQTDAGAPISDVTGSAADAPVGDAALVDAPPTSDADDTRPAIVAPGCGCRATTGDARHASLSYGALLAFACAFALRRRRTARAARSGRLGNEV